MSVAGHVAFGEARQERARVAGVRDERVQGVAVGVDRRAAHRAVLVAELVRLDRRRAPRAAPLPRTPRSASSTWKAMSRTPSPWHLR